MPTRNRAAPTTVVFFGNRELPIHIGSSVREQSYKLAAQYLGTGGGQQAVIVDEPEKERKVMPVNQVAFHRVGDIDTFLTVGVIDREVNLHDAAESLDRLDFDFKTLTLQPRPQLASDVGKGIINGVSQYLNKKLRTVKVHLKSGYKI